MNLRKQRRHLAGSSNADYKALSKNETERPQTMTTVDYLSLPKMKTINELMTIREKHIANAINPQDSTRNFYTSINKQKIDSKDNDHTRNGHLEDIDRRTRAYIGDSNIGLEPHSKNQVLIKRFSTAKSSSVALRLKPKSKRDVNSRAILETQQVAMPKMTVETSLEGIDLEKVKEARRAIRRKYANSKNFHKIFNLWDRESKGYISLKNIYQMMHDMGLNINQTECKVLLASADESGNGKMELNEFLDLIFNDFNVLNMKIEDIPNYGNIITEDKAEQTRAFVEQKAADTADRIHKNQIRLILKNKFRQLKKECMKEDQDNFGVIHFDLFKKIVSKLEINKNYISDKDLEEIFSENKYDNLNINYNQLLKTIDEFQFDPEQVYSKHIVKAEQAVNFEDHLMNPRFASLVKKMEEIRNTDAFNKIQTKNQPIEYVDRAFKTLIKTRRTLLNYFPTKQEFSDHIKKTIEINNLPKKDLYEDVNKKKKIYLQSDEFKKIIDQLFFNIKQDLTKRDLERLFTTFDYNKKGFINAEKVCDIIYDETDMNYAMRLCKKPKGPPPPADNDLDEIVLDQEDTKNKKLLKDPTDTSNRDINQILRAIDERCLIDNLNYFEKYNWFDKDKDRYVSMVDIKKKMFDLNQINKEECRTLVDYLDDQKKGFVKFDEFSKKIKRNMTNEGPNGELINYNIMQPGLPQVKMLINGTDKNKGTVKAAYDSVRPEKFQTVNVNTRYGSTPAFKNTFVNYQPPKTSQMHINEKDRLTRDIRARTAYQVEHKTKENFYQANRIERIRSRNNFITQKIANDNKLFLHKDDVNLKTKGAQQLFYEHVNHLRNPHV